MCSFFSCYSICIISIIDEEPPEYNVAERLRQLNAELAEEPQPEEKERSIKFKENLVDFEAPAPDYPSDEEIDDEGYPHGEGIDNLVAPMSDEEYENSTGESPRSPSGGDRGGGGDASQSQFVNSGQSPGTMTGDKPPSGQSKKTPPRPVPGSARDDEKVLVERDGKFELISAKDLTAEERDLYLAPVADEGDGTTRSGGSSEGSYDPSPPNKPRPATATGANGRRRVGSAAPRRVQSAQPHKIPKDQAVLEDFNYQSPYAISDQEKKRGKEQKKKAAEKEKKEKQLKEMEDSEKKRECNEAFQAWLAAKRREIASKRKDEKEEKKEEKEQEEQKKKVKISKNYLKLKLVISGKYNVACQVHPALVKIPSRVTQFCVTIVS